MRFFLHTEMTSHQSGVYERRQGKTQLKRDQFPIYTAHNKLKHSIAPYVGLALSYIRLSERTNDNIFSILGYLVTKQEWSSKVSLSSWVST